MMFETLLAWITTPVFWSVVVESPKLIASALLVVLATILLKTLFEIVTLSGAVGHVDALDLIRGAGPAQILDAVVRDLDVAECAACQHTVRLTWVGQVEASHLDVAGADGYQAGDDRLECGRGCGADLEVVPIDVVVWPKL